MNSFCGRAIWGRTSFGIISIRVKTDGLLGHNMQKGWQSVKILTTYVTIN